jgi:hypothetical protein
MHGTEHTKYVGKIFKFIFGFTRITDVDKDKVKLTIRHYNEDVDDKLVKKCCWFQLCLRSVSAHDSLEYQIA